MEKKLTPKQEKFCQGIVSGLNQSDAYRAAYSVSEDTKPESVNQMAWDLMQNVDIASRIEALKLPIAERLGLGLESYVKEMWDIKQKALSAEEYSAATKAFENVGKALGLYVNKTEISGSLDVNMMFDDISNDPESKIEV